MAIDKPKTQGMEYNNTSTYYYMTNIYILHLTMSSIETLVIPTVELTLDLVMSLVVNKHS